MSKWSEELKEKTRTELFPSAMVKDEEHNYGIVTEIEPKIVIKGVVNGAVVRLSIDQRFVTRLSSIIPVIREYGYDLFVKEKSAEERKLTNMEFLDNTSKLRPKIISRFKGLGEADADQLWETTLNPEKRSLVQLTFGDIERDIEIFNKLKSDKPKYQEQRKAMFEGYRIRRDDLDN